MRINNGGSLARSARILRWVTIGGILLVLAAMAFGSWLLLVGAESQGPLRFSVDTDGMAPLPAAIVLDVACALLILALLQMAAMLRAVEHGAPFRTGGRLRRFALYLFLALLASTLLPTLIGWIADVAAGQPTRITISLSGEEILMLFITGLLFFVARLLEAAQAVAEDHEQIV